MHNEHEMSILSKRILATFFKYAIFTGNIEIIVTFLRNVCYIVFSTSRCENVSGLRYQFDAVFGEEKF